ncbi:zinc ABC transporter substrate-binding protein ZnuA [Candidatus Erwinia haradaeae]|uniref:High-affinity zinc uptake system protein ZnuA n=1 Tax=Candidatus Erwinia haradaeae TaxID=1922217 RepID=A0A451D2I3_9GAMM|nr:zinc ABC transporter substrate-binding protein ZnuA [Candidatus Erwinia haradaeae]VFP79834.1 High-affinity zinc uptake system protein ZnuA [Candidatus Erwinia haradaeae]
MLHINYRKIYILAGIFMVGSLSFSTHATIIASVKPIGLIAASIADGITSVIVLLPDGESVHNYALRPSDIKHLKKAELVIWVGPAMEAFMSQAISNLPIQNSVEIDKIPDVQSLLLSNIKNKKIKNNYTHALKKNIAYQKNLQNTHYNSEYNMHLWMSPEIAKKTALAIYAQLLDRMPMKKDKLNANLKYFQNTILVANKKIHKQLASLKDKKYFVFHDAYIYFEKYYNITPTGYFTINPEIQPGAKRLHQIRMELDKQKGICVFSEPQFRPMLVKMFSHQNNVRSGTLDPLATGISLNKDGYAQFLIRLADQYTSCLQGS